MAARINIVSFCLFLCLFHHAISLCPYQCDCREEPSSCPAGVSLVMDGCNCCKVCAKQLAQQCNGDDAICDVHRNLFCDHSASRSGDIGICRARTGRPCWHGNVRISSGSMFEPSCKTRCWCMDGAIGCIPLCPHETQLPRPDRCPNARLQPVTGQCCDQWGCDTSSGDITILPLNNFWDEYVDVKSGDAPSENLLPEVGNGVRDGVIYEDDVGENADDLLDYQMTQTMNFNPELNLEESWHQNNFLPGDIFVHRHAAKVALERRRNCQAKSSQWSPCSKNCGLGVSARVSNNNGRCELARETRLCEFKPCNDLRYLPKVSGKTLERNLNFPRNLTLTR
ncbi:unnamed protein product [Clavelina lepadiformis]|uniref:Connective tissue growth factor n=1 Tax=Clavelina lepadiformis TaxID=159417 RepID=A0ABP0F0K6_CLALP